MSLLSQHFFPPTLAERRALITRNTFGLREEPKKGADDPKSSAPSVRSLTKELRIV